MTTSTDLLSALFATFASQAAQDPRLCLLSNDTFLHRYEHLVPQEVSTRLFNFGGCEDHMLAASIGFAHHGMLPLCLAPTLTLLPKACELLLASPVLKSAPLLLLAAQDASSSSSPEPAAMLAFAPYVQHTRVDLPLQLEALLDQHRSAPATRFLQLSV